MQIRKINRTTICLIAIIALLMGCLVYATVKYTKIISNTITVTGYEIRLWRLDSATEVTVIQWGNMNTGTSKTSDTALGLSETAHKLAIKNTGDYAVYVGWRIDPETPLPAGVSLTGWHANEETEPYQQTWNENTFTFFVSPDSVSTWRIRWVLTIGDEVPKGNISFNIILMAADSSTGQAISNAETQTSLFSVFIILVFPILAVLTVLGWIMIAISNEED